MGIVPTLFLSIINTLLLLPNNQYMLQLLHPFFIPPYNKLIKAINNIALNNNLVSMEEIFVNFKTLKLNTRKLELFLNGVMLTFNNPDGVYNIYDQDDKYIGTGTIKNNLLKRDIII